MSVSFSGVRSFQDIDWASLKDRPPIDKEHFCTEENWSIPTPCCMDGYAIEHVIDIGHLNGHGESAALKFLNTYPCLNGVELDGFFERFSSPRSVVLSPSGQLSKKSVRETDCEFGADRLTQMIGSALQWVRRIRVLLGGN